MTLAGGSSIFLGFVVFYTLVIIYSLYTRTGSGINQRPWGEDGLQLPFPRRDDDVTLASLGARTCRRRRAGPARAPAAQLAFAAEAVALQHRVGGRVVDVGMGIEALDAPLAHRPVARQPTAAVATPRPRPSGTSQKPTSQRASWRAKLNRITVPSSSSVCGSAIARWMKSSASL